MPEHKQKRRNSVPPLRTQGVRDMAPEQPDAMAQLPNSARNSLAEQSSVYSEELERKFGQHRLPSEEQSSIRLAQAPQLDEQAKPDTAFQKHNWLSRAYAGLRDKTFGRMARRHKRAYDDIMEHKQDKSYYGIGKVNRFLYFMKNPLAVMHSWGSKDSWKEAHDAKTQEEQALVAQYRADKDVQALDHDNYHWGTDSVPEENARLPGEAVPEGQEVQQEAEQKAPEKIVGNAKYGPSGSVTNTLLKDVPMVDTLLKTDIIKDHPAAKWFTTEDRQFLPENMMEKASFNDMAIMTGSTLQTMKGIKGIAKSVSDIKKSAATGLKAKKTNAVLSLFSSILGTARMAGMAAGKIGDKFKKLMPERVANALKWGSKPRTKLFGKDFSILNALGVANSGMGVLKGFTNMASGARTKGMLGDVKDRVQSEQLDGGEKTSLNKLTRQAGSAASQRLIEGAGGILNGVAGAANSVALPGPFGTIAKVGGVGLEKLTGLVSGGHQSRMDKKVLKEDMPGLDDEIEAYARKLAIDKNLDPGKVGALEHRQLRRKAKHIILKAHGFASGKRSEAVAFFNTARAKYLEKRANRQQEGNVGDDIAKDLVDAIGVDRRGEKFHENDIAERLGRKRTQEGVIASRSSNIEALAQKKNRGFWNNTKRLLGWMFS